MRKYKKRKKKITSFFALIPKNIRPPKNRFGRKFICRYKISGGQMIFFDGTGKKALTIPFKEKDLVIL